MDCAIVGVSARFSQQRTIEDFWQALCQSDSWLAEMPETRRTLNHQNSKRRWSTEKPAVGMFLDEIDGLDRHVFSLSPAALMFMDPRQRLFLEACWSAVENAGMKVGELAGRRVGVYAAIDSWYLGSYLNRVPASLRHRQELLVPGNDPCFVANRVSNTFDLSGPSVVVNTTCSGVFSGIHQARGALANGEIDYAIVGGVTLFLDPWRDGESAATAFESNRGCMRSFAADADGYVTSEGCGALLLCRADRDTVSRLMPYGVVAGSGINTSGRTRSFAQASAVRQATLLRNVVADAGVEVDHISYVEAHGISAPQADAIEMSAYAQVLARRNDYCVVSTLKPNLGHNHASSGVYGILKVLNSLRDGVIAPIRGWDDKTVNPAVVDSLTNLQVADQALSWPSRGTPRYAQLMSYGFSNVNASVIVSDRLPSTGAVPVSMRPDVGSRESCVVCVSGRSEAQVREQLCTLATYSSRSSATLREVAYTLIHGREKFDIRWACVVSSFDELRSAIEECVDAGDSTQAVMTGVSPGTREFADGTERLLWNMALAWVGGEEVDWSSLYGDGTGKRAHIPGYAFDKQKYWVPVDQVEEADGAIRPAMEGQTMEQNETSEAAQMAWDQEKEQPIVSEALVRELTSDLLGLEASAIDLDLGLDVLGFDSAILVSFFEHLNQRLGLELSPTLFFEATSLRSLMIALNQHAATPSLFKRVVPKRIQSSAEERIAIVGVSGKFPEADGLDELWDNLLCGRSCTGEVPGERWDWRSLPDIDATGARWGGFIDGMADFDPLFFNISPKEAEFMDPQQRLTLLYTYLALLDWGHKPSSIAGSNTGLFLGTKDVGYLELCNRAGIETQNHSAMGSLGSMGPNRVSYFLDITGPSELVETACSSSLVALHRGRQALLNGECEVVVVGGVNTIVLPSAHLSLSRAGMLAPDGLSKPFSDQANGYVRSEGVGMLVMRPLSAAEADGDHIYAVVRGSAVNHGGRSSSLTAPNVKAQEAVVAAAYDDASVEPRTVSYLEAHGTGTQLGDPIEIEALQRCFKREPGMPSVPCGVGSVKSNIGHLELGAGIAGVIKVLLQMKHRTLVKTLHCSRVNPLLNLSTSPLYVVRQNQPWRRFRDEQGDDIPRRAGVSSFGVGGVNAHVVLEEHEGYSRTEPSTECHLVVLSARSESVLRCEASVLQAFLRRSEVDLRSLAYTLQVGREEFHHRLAIPVTSSDELDRQLDAFLNDQQGDGFLSGNIREDDSLRKVLEQDRQIIEVLSSGVHKLDAKAIGRCWVQGVDVDWRKLYGGKMQRISIPSRPFELSRYWLPKHDAQQSATGSRWIGPLLHENVSTFQKHRFLTTLRADHPVVAQHVIDGREIFPGVGYLEMALEAARRLFATDSASRFTILDVVWCHPLIITGQRKIVIEFFNASAESADFEIFDDHEAAKVFARGRVEHHQTPCSQETIDLPTSHSAESIGSLDHAQCYESFRAVGVDYGPDFRCLHAVRVGEDARVAEIFSDAPDLESYLLPPGILDSALQAAMLDDKEPTRRMLPLSVRSVEVFGPVPATTYAIIRLDGSDRSAMARSANIMLADSSGRLCVRMRGLVGKSDQSDSVFGVAPIQQPASSPEVRGVESQDQTDFAVRYVIRVLSEKLRISTDLLDPEEALDTIGIDSVMAMEITETLEADLGQVSQTFLFDCGCLLDVANYLLETHADALQRLAERDAKTLPCPPERGSAPSPGLMVVDQVAKPDKAEPRSDALSRETVVEFVRRTLASTLKLPVEALDAEEPMDHFGIDSVMAMEVTEALEAVLEPLAPSFIFDCSTINEVGEYLLTNHEPALRAAFAATSGVPGSPDGGASITPSYEEPRAGAKVVIDAAADDAREQATPTVNHTVTIRTVDSSLATPCWIEDPVDASPGDVRRRVIVIGPSERSEVASALEAEMVLDKKTLSLAESFTATILGLRGTLENLLEMRRGADMLQIVVMSDAEWLRNGVAALARTLANEYQTWRFQVLQFEGAQVAPQTIAQALEVEACTQENEVRYVGGTRYVKRWQLCDAEQHKMPWREGGSYVISGGLGEIGLRCAEAIVAATSGGSITLLGRRTLEASDAQRISELATMGHDVQYRSVDVGDLAAVQGIVDEVARNSGGIDGVLHCAGVVDDALFIRKEDADFRAVLHPKVSGTENLDLATRSQNLDFFVMFSSGASVIGNRGQSDYAAANGFMDGYARYRTHMANRGLRSGVTVSVNWPLWESGGMGLDPKTVQKLSLEQELAPMPTEIAMSILNQAIAQRHVQLMAFYSRPGRLRELLPGIEPDVVGAPDEIDTMSEEEIDRMIASLSNERLA